jgi:hypothetical protein
VRAEILRMVHQMADEIRALKARVEAVHAQSTSAKEATALEGLKARLGAVKAETGAEIAELAGKVDRLQSEVTMKLAKASERFDRPNNRGSRALPLRKPRAATPSMHHDSVFDLLCDAVFQHWLLAADLLQRQLAAFVVKLLEVHYSSPAAGRDAVNHSRR